jgi:molybdenum-dependent DNA-binding transcriptional regulator ModE
MSMAYSDDKNIIVVIDNVDDQMRLKRVETHRRRDLNSFSRHSRVGRNQIEQIEQLKMVVQRLLLTKESEAGFGNRNNIVFSFFREPEAHFQS